MERTVSEPSYGLGDVVGVGVGRGVGVGVGLGLGDSGTIVMVTVTVPGSAVTPSGGVMVTVRDVVPVRPLSEMVDVGTESSALSSSCGPDSTTVAGFTLIPTSSQPDGGLPVCFGTTALAREVWVDEMMIVTCT